MIRVVPPTKDVGRIVGPQRVGEGETLRPSTRVVVVPCRAGTLLHHTLTSETLLLDESEAASWTDACGPLAAELVASRFLVPEDADEMALDDQVSRVLELMRTPRRDYDAFTVLTTTDCNARCFYCYELGRSRVTMDDATALEAARFMARSCGGKRVSLTWFGGEPLCNTHAIDLIVFELARLGVEFRSHMVSNCLLLDADLARHAREAWNLERVQVTIDGTREAYRRTKAYVGLSSESDPFGRVLDNVGHLLDAGVSVEVRMNLHQGNGADLAGLGSLLSARFGGREGFGAYAALLRDDDARPLGYADDDEALASYAELADRLRKAGLHRPRGVGGKRRRNHCMADAGTSLMILPDGRLGLCEHYSESETVGSVYEGVTDDALVSAWRVRLAPQPQCATCPHHPTCTDLRRCPYSAGGCTRLLRRLKDADLAERVVAAFESWAASDGASASGWTS